METGNQITQSVITQVLLSLVLLWDTLTFDHWVWVDLSPIRWMNWPTSSLLDTRLRLLQNDTWNPIWFKASGRINKLRGFDGWWQAQHYTHERLVRRKLSVKDAVQWLSAYRVILSTRSPATDKPKSSLESHVRLKSEMLHSRFGFEFPLFPHHAHNYA